MLGSRHVFLTQLIDQVVRNSLSAVREWLKSMEGLGSGLRPGAMLAGQRLAGQVGQHRADAAPLSPNSLLNRAENVIVH